MREGDVHVRIRPGKSNNRFGGRSSLTVTSVCGRMAPPANPAWCGCDGQPAKWNLPAPAGSQDLSVLSYTWSGYAIDAIESISLTFHKPVEEPFDVSSPPLK